MPVLVVQGERDPFGMPPGRAGRRRSSWSRGRTRSGPAPRSAMPSRRGWRASRAEVAGGGLELAGAVAPRRQRDAGGGVGVGRVERLGLEQRVGEAARAGRGAR